MSSSKKRMWSKEELERDKFDTFISAVVISVFLSIAFVYFLGFQNGGTWQPYNCVNETRIDLVECNVKDCDSHSIIQAICEGESPHANCHFFVAINVSTGRQICPDKALIKHETTILDSSVKMEGWQHLPESGVWFNDTAICPTKDCAI